MANSASPRPPFQVEWAEDNCLASLAALLVASLTLAMATGRGVCCAESGNGGCRGENRDVGCTGSWGERRDGGIFPGRESLRLVGRCCQSMEGVVNAAGDGIEQGLR